MINFATFNILYGKEEDIPWTFVEAASDKAAAGAHCAFAGERHRTEVVPDSCHPHDDSAVDSIP
jgi:hypothetical protein